MSDAESSGTAEAPTADSLALVPLTPDDTHAPSLRRSSRERKKPRPCYEASQAEPPDKPSIRLFEVITQCLTPFSMTSQCLFGHLRLCLWHMSLVHVNGFDLFGMYDLNMLSLTKALLGVHFDLTCFFSFFLFVGYRVIVHLPSDDGGTERTWFVPEQRPGKRDHKRSVHGKQSPQGASKMFWRL